MRKIDTMSLEECRALYARILGRSEARNRLEFNAATLAIVGEAPALPLGVLPSREDETKRARAFVKAARKVRFCCRRCAGTGAFVTYVENGQPKGPGGPCFRCAGRGTQDDADVMRNEAHDRYAAARACAAMFAGH